MKKSNYFIPILLSVIISISSISCKKVDVPDGTPHCIKKKIRQLKPHKVWRFDFQGETAYYFPPECCDIPSQLFDCDCNEICKPDGGLSGGGDGKCKDFFKTRTNEVLVWEDDRKTN